jgi:hypothetical protein
VANHRVASPENFNRVSVFAADLSVVFDHSSSSLKV